MSGTSGAAKRHKKRAAEQEASTLKKIEFFHYSELKSTTHSAFPSSSLTDVTRVVAAVPVDETPVDVSDTVDEQHSDKETRAEQSVDISSARDVVGHKDLQTVENSNYAAISDLLSRENLTDRGHFPVNLNDSQSDQI